MAKCFSLTAQAPPISHRHSADIGQPALSPAERTPSPTVAELAPHFPELEILERIGVGGMGAVYKARQPKLDRLVALKILSHDLAGDPAFAERFNREARVLARLNHPNVVTVFDFGTEGPFCFLLTELTKRPRYWHGIEQFQFLQNKPQRGVIR